ncbi:Tfp pilus assembly protein PilO [Paraburkholderia sp. GAS348]
MINLQRVVIASLIGAAVRGLIYLLHMKQWSDFLDLQKQQDFSLVR